MTAEEKEKIKMWIVNVGLRIDSDLQEARDDFWRNQNPWFAFRLALAGERKNAFDIFAAQLFALLHI